VTANIFYRLSGEAAFPAALQDGKAAVRFLRADAERYGLDADRIGSVGGSAGGWLSGLLATSGGVERLEGASGVAADGSSYSNHAGHSSRLQAACVMAGITDLSLESARANAASDPRRRTRTFLGGTWETARASYVDASAITHVDERCPPILFMDGEFDSPGTRYNTVRPKMKRFGVRSEERVIRGAPHAYWSSHPFYEEAMGHLVRFFGETLKGKD
jgi:pectinesterase